MLTHILNKSKKQLWLTYLLLIIEFTASSSTPWLLGKTLDAIIQQQYQMFWLYVICSIGGLLVGIVRRRFDTRVFMKIWKDLIVQTTEDFFSRNVLVSKITARTNNIQKFTSFFEFCVPQIVRSVIYIVVALFALYSSMGVFSFIIIGIMTISLSASMWFSNKIESNIRCLQHAQENKEHNILQKDVINVKNDYDEIYQLTIKKSDWEAANWGAADVCCIICELIAICVLAKTTPTVGQITSSLMYVNSLCGHFSSFSYFITYFKELKIAKEYLQKD